MKSHTSQPDQITQLIFGLSRQLKELMQAHRPAELSMLHIGTLHYVAEQGQPLMSDIAAHLCITRPSATSLIQGLVRAGYLRRLTDRHDKRSVRLALTPRGKKMLAQGFHYMNTQLRKIIGALSATEQQQFIVILTKLVNRLQQ
jgi:DNA-binding MarR family transcriptional regulator